MTNMEGRIGFLIWTRKKGTILKISRFYLSNTENKGGPKLKQLVVYTVASRTREQKRKEGKEKEPYHSL